MPVPILRLVSLLTALLLVAAGWQMVGEFGGADIRRSPLKLLALAALAVSGLAFGFAGCMPGRWWSAILRRGRSAVASLAATAVPSGRLQALLLGAAGIVAYLLIAGRFAALHINERVNDTAAFLNHAREVRNAGGPVGLIQRLYSGDYAEANQHPLFIGLLSVSPTLEQGKRLTIAIGLLALITFGWLAAQRFGGLVGAVLVALLATNFAFVHESTLVTCEPLLILFCGLIWFCLDSKRTGTGDWRQAAVAGGLLGLVYLTKGTGPLILLGVVLWMLTRSKSESSSGGRERYRHLLVTMVVLLASFTVVASPLLVRNLRRYGTPFYNVNSHLMFQDSFADPKRLAKAESLGEAARRYLREHSLADLSRRELSGIVWQSFIVVRSLGPTPLDDSRILLGGLLLGLAVFSTFVERRASGSLLGIWLALSVIVFGWYVPIAAGERFVVPLLAPVLMYSSLALVRMTHQRFEGKAANVLLAAGLVWIALWTIWTCLSPSLADRF